MEIVLIESRRSKLGKINLTVLIPLRREIFESVTRSFILTTFQRV